VSEGNGQDGPATPLEPVETGANGRDAETGRFAPGNAFARGNPSHKRRAELRSAIDLAVKDGEVEIILAAVADKAKKGDTFAASLWLSYAVGKPKSISETAEFDMPANIVTAADFAGAYLAVLHALAEGRLDIGQASAIGSLLEGGRSAVEFQEFDRRLKTIEDR
jgi:hypothetical protein